MIPGSTASITITVIPLSSDRDPTLLAFVTFNIYNQFIAGDIGLHIRDDEYYLLYPTKRLRDGFVHYFKIIDKVMGETLLKQAVAAYRQAVTSERDREVTHERCGPAANR